MRLWVRLHTDIHANVGCAGSVSSASGVALASAAWADAAIVGVARLNACEAAVASNASVTLSDDSTLWRSTTRDRRTAIASAVPAALMLAHRSSTSAQAV